MLLIIGNLYGQKKIEIKLEKLEALFAVIRDVTPKYYDGVQKYKLKLSEYDLEKTKDLFYYAYAHVSIEVRNKKNALYKKWNNTDRKTIKPNLRMKMVEEAIIEKYGQEYVGYLKTPYVFKIKVINVFSSKYSTGRKRRGQEIFVMQINVKVKLLDILKGKEYYTIGDTVTIAY